MIKLVNIRKKGNIVSADVETVEKEPRKFKIAIDVKTEKIIECTSKRFGLSESGAAAKLFKLYAENGENLPKTETAAWY